MQKGDQGYWDAQPRPAAPQQVSGVHLAERQDPAALLIALAVLGEHDLGARWSLYSEHAVTQYLCNISDRAAAAVRSRKAEYFGIINLLLCN